MLEVTDNKIERLLVKRARVNWILKLPARSRQELAIRLAIYESTKAMETLATASLLNVQHLVNLPFLESRAFGFDPNDPKHLKRLRA